MIAANFAVARPCEGVEVGEALESADCTAVGTEGVNGKVVGRLGMVNVLESVRRLG